MARPKKDNADYFSHDSGMRNDPKIKALRKKHGFMGYAIWCYLLEVLTASDFFEHKWSELNKELLSGDFDCDTTDLDSIIEYCVKIELLVLDNGVLYSNQLKKRFAPLLSKRKRDTERLSPPKTHKVKESKGKESKVEEKWDKPKSFNFKKSLIDLGVKKEIVEGWLVVRKSKKATNTDIAFNAIEKQLELSPLNANDSIKMAVENSWSGFKAQWVINNLNDNGTYQKNNGPIPTGGKQRQAEEGLVRDAAILAAGGSID